MFRRLALCLVVLGVAAAGGCLFSSDDDPVPQASSGWAPEFHITPDSVTVWFPNDWPDTTTWTWNVLGQGAWEYVMEASVPVEIPHLGPVRVYLAFVHESNCRGRQTGTFEEMAADGAAAFWVEDAVTKKYVSEPILVGAPVIGHDGVKIESPRFIADWIYGNAPERKLGWTATFERRILFRPGQARGPVRYAYDVAQKRAWEVRGPLSRDDYAVMDRVLRAYLPNGWPATVVVDRSVTLYSGAEGVQGLLPDPETVDGFEAVIHTSLDVSALSQLGYTMVAREDVDISDDRLYLSLSAVGYNRARDEALVYGAYECGNLCAAGEMFLLAKVGEYWVIRGRVLLWIS